ncbi:MAG: mechanosensitive ion channel domain-containing protein [Bryobacteraceae bacterium]
MFDGSATFRHLKHWIPGVMLLALVLPLAAQQSEGDQLNTGFPVVLEGRTVAVVYAPRVGFSAPDRAKAIAQRLEQFAEDRSLSPDLIRSEELSGHGTLIFARNIVFMLVTDADAAAAHLSKPELAAQIAANMRDAVIQYRSDWSVRNVVKYILYALAATAVLVALLFGLTSLHRAIRRHLLAWTRALRLKKHALSAIITPRRVAAVLLTAQGALRWLVIVLLLQAYVSVLFGIFPNTAGLVVSFYGWLLAPLQVLWAEFVAYLPNLFFVIVISFITFFVLKLNRLIFLEIRDGKITFSGFDTDWAEPTSKLVNIVIFSVAMVVVFPYLPGSSSPAFKGISILFGVLLSFGSGSAVANMISGAMLTYMRPYHLGDRVKIADTVGDVAEKGLLVTRVRTIKNVFITIPNAAILNSHILNYSTSARDVGLIVHSSVTIGYDTPWRQVHELLIAAAAATPDTLNHPRPFVFQTALNDFFVSYQINVYTAAANHMDNIASALHQNIQDQFNAAGVEIMSPHYTSLRDGNTIAVPEANQPPGYRPPSFRVNLDRPPEP